MGYTNNPEYLLLKTNAIYTSFHRDASIILNNKLDIIELVNQAIDTVTNTMYSESMIDSYIVYDLMRQNNISDTDKNTLNKLYLKLCGELRCMLKELNASSIFDTFNGDEIYPYYFYKVIRNKIILKRF